MAHFRVLSRDRESMASGARRSSYTLVEILVAMTLTLILMTAVVTVFGGVGEGIAKSRRAMEQFDRLRTAAQQLRSDLGGVTVTLDGHPTRPEENRGYFEYIEGGIFSVPQWQWQATGSSGTLMMVSSGTPAAINEVTGQVDLDAGERGDILMFTTRNATRPFLGRYQLATDPTNPTLQSDVAEVAWFLRGKTLHRRVLLVAPGVAQNPGFSFSGSGSLTQSTYYLYNDISAHLVGGQLTGGQLANAQLAPNSLADLTSARIASRMFMALEINRHLNLITFPSTHVTGEFWDFPRCTSALRRLGWRVSIRTLVRHPIGSPAPRRHRRVQCRQQFSRWTIGTPRLELPASLVLLLLLFLMLMHPISSCLGLPRPTGVWYRAPAAPPLVWPTT